VIRQRSENFFRDDYLIQKAGDLLPGLLQLLNFFYLKIINPPYNFTNCLYNTLSPLIIFTVYIPLVKVDTSNCKTLAELFNFTIFITTPDEDKMDRLTALFGCNPIV
jgi:hypothetical protein